MRRASFYSYDGILPIVLLLLRIYDEDLALFFEPLSPFLKTLFRAVHSFLFSLATAQPAPLATPHL